MTDQPTPPPKPVLRLTGDWRPQLTWIRTRPEMAREQRILASLDCSDCHQPWWYMCAAEREQLPTVCPACIAYRTKPWWRRALNRLTRKDR